MQNKEQQVSAAKRPQHHTRGRERDRFFTVRNILNILFMLTAIVGVIIYITNDDRTPGTIVVLVAMAFKIVECGLRFIK